MNTHLLKLGSFKFAVNTAAFRQLKQQWTFNIAAQARIGNTPALQFTGQGEQSLSLSGIVYPGQFGSITAIDDLVKLAAAGKPLQIISGTGAVMGFWYIKNISNTKTIFLPSGIPRKIEFTLSLTYYGKKYR
jgi:phage tail protein